MEQEETALCACRAKLLFLYKAYFASYASGLLMLVFWDTRRNDFWAMLLHHTVTLVLVALSYHLGCVSLLQIFTLINIVKSCAFPAFLKSM